MDQNYNGNGMVFGGMPLTFFFLPHCRRCRRCGCGCHARFTRLLFTSDARAGDNNTGSFFSFDASTLDHQPSGETILNDTEDDYLSTFFDNPNMAQQMDAYDPLNMFNLGGKSLSQGTFSATPAFGHNHNNNNLDPSALDPSHPQPHYQSSHHMTNMSGQPHHQQQQQQQPGFTGHAGFLADSPSQTQTQTMNHADINAATSLYGFTNKTMPHPHSFSPTGSGGPLAGSWGNINIPINTGSASYTAAPSAGGRAPDFTAHSQGWDGNGDMSHATSPQSARGAESQYLMNPFHGVQPLSNPPQQALQRQFPGVDFGSDPNFNNTHYQGRQHSKDKSGNLLNVPLADKVRGPYGPHAVANQHTKPQNSATWGRFGTTGFSRPSDEDELASSSQARKRHKGQDGRGTEHIKVEQTDEDISVNSMAAPSSRPIAQPSSAIKRRKATAGQSLPVSNSPPAIQGDDGGEASARKRGAKKRENLSEDQKRKNHIYSEKKRREIIQQGYNDLNKLVPCLGGKSGLSRSECLQEISSYLETLYTGNAKMMELMGDDLDENHPELQAVHTAWAVATAKIE